MRFWLPSIKCLAAPPSFRLVECAVIKSLSRSSDNQTVLGSSRRLEGAAEHLIDSSEKRICRLSFEF